MKEDSVRWQTRFRTMGAVLRRPRRTTLEEPARSGPAPTSAGDKTGSLRARIGTAALAFRGYDVSNLGRSPELLSHPIYGTIVRATLDETSAIAAAALGEPVDLAAYVEAQQPAGLENFAIDVALIVGIELAQLRVLEQVFGVEIRRARVGFGYSIGELSALVHSGVIRLDQILPVPLGLARDCAELAANVSMGILFTRAPELPEDDVDRLCLAVSSEGHGLIGPSAWLSPNTALLLGQGDTVDRLQRAMGSFLPPKVMLRRNPNRWPPLHTPIVRLRNIPNRTAAAIYAVEGEFHAPSPPVISCVSGKADYEPVTTREQLVSWTDHPQRLWDAVDGTLASGCELILHVGPSPNLVPATFARLSNNVSKYLGNGYLHRMGRGVVQSMNRHAWLSHILPHRASLLRAPYLENIILEDWLLEQPIPGERAL
jgi:[acyl-carrier-protein] S-malonyltransferase